MRNLLVALVLCLATMMQVAEGEAVDWKVLRDIPFAEVNGRRLALDLYVPQRVEQPPVIVWVHGGAWRRGSRNDVPIRPLAARFAIASVDYRLTPVAPFPAQVHDIKAAIRFLRGEGDRFGIDADRLAIAGASAGGHLAALVGVSTGQAELEGTVGNHLEESAAVGAIISFYGASNLETILSQSTPHGLGVRVPALQLLLGGQPDEKLALARLASPVHHVDPHDPPLLLIHGDQDPQMPINQAHELHGAYLKLGLPVQFEVVHGGAHGGKLFFGEEQLQRVATFLEKHLKDARADGKRLERGDEVSFGSAAAPFRPEPWQHLAVRYEGDHTAPITVSVRFK